MRVPLEYSARPLSPPELDVSMPLGRTARLQEKGYVKHPKTVWTDKSNADEALCAQLDHAKKPMGGVVGEWLTHLEGRDRATSPETIAKYRKSLTALCKTIREADEPLTLASLTPAAVDRWVSQQRFAARSAEGIASRLAAVKTFTRSYLWLEAKYTKVDLLADVKRHKAPETAKPMLDEEERGRIFEVFGKRGAYEDVRNDAFLTALLATGLRYNAVLLIQDGDVDRATRRVKVTEKGGVAREVELSPGAWRKVRRWLSVRRAAEGVTALWTTVEGQPLSYWGGQSFMKRLKERAGVKRVHFHLFRHTFGQGALLKGASEAEAQDMYGHKTPAMTRRYTKTIREQKATTNMTKYALV